MHISFRSVQKATDGLVLHDSIQLPRLSEENTQVRDVGPIVFDGTAEGTEVLCQVKGTLQTTVAYQCSRCLDHFSRPLHAAFDEAFTNVESKADGDIHFVNEDEIVLDSYIEETINLAFEYVPVCRDDCKGLCPECGSNKNEVDCTCDTRKIDPRLAALQDLLSKDDSE